MDQFCSISVSGTIVNEPEISVKNGTNGTIRFKILNHLELAPGLVKDTHYYLDFYTRDCAEVVKKFKVGDIVMADGQLYSSVSGSMTYLNIRADQLRSLGDRVQAVSPTVNITDDIYDEEV